MLPVPTNMHRLLLFSSNEHCELPLGHSSAMHGWQLRLPLTGRRADMKQWSHVLGNAHSKSGFTHASFLHWASLYAVPDRPACSARMMPYRPSRNSSWLYAHTMTPP